MPLLRARTPKHARPSKAAPVLAAGGLTAALVLADAAAASASAPSSEWDRLAHCESSGNWAANTGNGYYGGLQFSLSTWRGVGGVGRPDQASRAEQIRRANVLHDARGFSPWPSCSRKLGLRSGPADIDEAGAGTTRAVARASRSRRTAAPSTAARPAVSVSLAPGSAPRFDGHVLSVADRGRYLASAAQWQQRMRARGWRIAVDGRFGPQSAGVAQRFAAEKGLRPARAGTVDRAVWTASWVLPTT